MSKLWLVARYEYRKNVLQKSFIMVLLSVPLVLTLMFGLIAVMIQMEKDETAVGYVDLAGLLDDPAPAPKRGTSPDDPDVPDLVPLLPFDTEQEARQALDDGDIRAYYVISQDYFTTKRVELVYFKRPDYDATRQFWDFMQINRLDDLPPEVAHRAVAGSNLIVRWPSFAPGGGREFSSQTFFNSFVPLIIGVAFVALIFMSSGYLMGAVVEEKENRTMEMVMTSISPTQFIVGKVLGIVAIALTQLLAWIIFIALLAFVGGTYLGADWLTHVRLDLRMLGAMVAVAAPTYVMFAALLAALGATVADTQQAQQISGLGTSLVMAPVWLMLGIIIEDPDNVLTTILTLFPTSALPTLSFRLGFAPVPEWQIVASVAIVSLSALGALWLAGRAFRLGMLRYGQRLGWRELVGRDE
jgi:ABC-2 type transport system permease protein